MENNKIDSNYIIGIVLLFLMYGTYVYFLPEQPIEETQKITTEVKKAADTTTDKPDIVVDSAQLQKTYGNLAAFAMGTEQTYKIENDVAVYTFNSKGGTIESVVLKKYKTYDNFTSGKNQPMELIDKSNSETKLNINTPSGIVNLKNLYYDAKVNETKDSSIVTFSLNISENQSVSQRYVVYKDKYSVDYKLNLGNIDNLLANKTVTLEWADELKQLENDLSENRKAAQINYYDIEDDFNDIGANKESDESENIEEKLKWFSFKQKYFVSGFVGVNSNLEKANFTIDTPENDSSIVKRVEAKVNLDYDAISSGKGDYRYYFGPNDYDKVKEVAEGFNQNVYLGYDIIKPVNKFLFVPLFNWFETFIKNYGLLIIVVVLVIKISLTPLIYKSYSSSAKMRVMAPEINAIKERVGDDQMKVQQETMALYKQVGVSPLSGCVPMLLQMPILMSVFFLFPNMIMFRQQSFLWASDLSTYDAPIQWATSIPLIGNHLSLFVVLMTLSSLAFTYYNNQITPDQAGPVDMKKISYIFPLVFFFVLNSFPAALSFYYLMSNLVTIGQQLIVRKFIDEDKIRAVLDENRKNYNTKPKKKNKFSEFMEKQLKQQEEANRQKANELAAKKKSRK